MKKIKNMRFPSFYHGYGKTALWFLVVLGVSILFTSCGSSSGLFGPKQPIEIYTISGDQLVTPLSLMKETEKVLVVRVHRAELDARTPQTRSAVFQFTREQVENLQGMLNRNNHLVVRTKRMSNGWREVITYTVQ